MTTSLSRGISRVRFFKLCSRAPPILMKSFAITAEFFVKNNPTVYRGVTGGWQQKFDDNGQKSLVGRAVPARRMSNQIPKERMRRLACRPAQLVPRTLFDLGGQGGDFFHVGRLTTFAAIRHRREKRAIGLEHEFVHRCSGKNVAHILSVFERKDACKT